MILGADFVDLHPAVKVQLDVVLLRILFYFIFFVCGLTPFFKFFGCSGVVGMSSDCLLEVFMHGGEVGNFFKKLLYKNMYVILSSWLWGDPQKEKEERGKKRFVKSLAQNWWTLHLFWVFFFFLDVFLAIIFGCGGIIMIVFVNCPFLAVNFG